MSKFLIVGLGNIGAEYAQANASLPLIITNTSLGYLANACRLWLQLIY